MKQFLPTLLFIGIFFGCETKEVGYMPQNIYYSYFPLEEGTYREYEVQYINIDAPSNVYDTSHYYLLESYDEFYLNPSGDSMLRVERYIKNNPGDTYKLSDVWSVYLNDMSVISVEENISYVKLKFPVSVNLSWDANAYNRLDTLQEFQSTIVSLDIPLQLSEVSFDSTLRVSQREKLSIVDKIEFFEVYANHVGLVQKQEIDIYSEDVDPQIPIDERVTRGTFYYQKLITHGKN